MLTTFLSTRTLRTCLQPSQFRYNGPLSVTRNLPRLAVRSEHAASRTSFRQQLYRERPATVSFQDGVQKPPIGRQVAFALFGSVTSFFVAAHLTNSDTEKWNKILSVTPWRKPTSEDMNRARFLDFFHKLQRSIESFKKATESWPRSVSDLLVWCYAQMGNVVINGGDGRRITFSICAANAAVFLMWQMRRLQPFMNRAFLHHPLSGLSYTLLTSAFSHQSLMHFLFNSAALISFGSATVVYFRQQQAKNPSQMKESTPKYHFYAFFISAGLFSGLVAHIAATRIRFPRAIKQLASSASTATATARRSLFTKAKPDADVMPFLGASGAIYATVTLTALAFPTAQVALFFLPGFSLPISVGVGGMVLFDIIGIIRGWTLFAHWAHLGGATFGVFYQMYGAQIWNWFRLVTNVPKSVNFWE